MESSKATAIDVAAYILVALGTMSSMKLQKLVYYCQAWSLVWDERPLFGDRIEAWANGPVIPALYQAHKGQFEISMLPGDVSMIDSLGKESIEAVLKFYGDKTAPWLSELTHEETPWLAARAGLPNGAPGSREITLASMAEYYSGL